MKQFMTAKEVAATCGVSLSSGYKICRQLNEELQKNGYLVLSGKVPRRYLLERIYGGTEIEQGAD